MLWKGEVSCCTAVLAPLHLSEATILLLFVFLSKYEIYFEQNIKNIFTRWKERK